MGGKQRCPGGPVPTPERARFLGTSARPTAALAQPESGFLEVTARGWGGGAAPGAWQGPDFRPAQAQVGVGRPLPCCATPGPRLTPSFPELTVGWGSTPRSPGSRTPPPPPRSPLCRRGWPRALFPLPLRSSAVPAPSRRPPPAAPQSAGVGGAREGARPTGSQVTLLRPLWGPRFESQWPVHTHSPLTARCFTFGFVCLLAAKGFWSQGQTEVLPPALDLRFS